MSRVRRVPDTHTYNNSVFSSAARREAAAERARSQVFQYREGTSSDDWKDREMKSTGPTYKMSFCTDNGDKIAAQGIEYETGGRLYKTDDQGCITMINAQWLRDRQAEAEDQRDYLFSLVGMIMSIEDPKVCEQIFGKAMWAKVVAANCTPSELSMMPQDSQVFFTKSAQLKEFIRERNLAPDSLITLQNVHSHKGYSGHNVNPDAIDGMMALGPEPDGMGP